MIRYYALSHAKILVPRRYCTFDRLHPCTRSIIAASNAPEITSFRGRDSSLLYKSNEECHSCLQTTRHLRLDLRSNFILSALQTQRLDSICRRLIVIVISISLFSVETGRTRTASSDRFIGNNCRLHL